MKLKRRHYLILEEMLKHLEGVTRKEIVELIQRDGETGYNRKAFVKDLPLIRQAMDIDIFSRDCGKNVWRYSIGRSTPDQQERAKMVGILVANILENLFLKEFRELGEKVQPLVIPRGHEHLHVIGTALRGNRILSCTYRKFSDSEPYDCTLRPYALKACEGRWYLIARKNAEREFKHFSLDRIQRLELTDKTFRPVPFKAKDFYAPFFGSFCDQKLKPQSIAKGQTVKDPCCVASTTVGKLQYSHGGTGVFPRWYWNCRQHGTHVSPAVISLAARSKARRKSNFSSTSSKAQTQCIRAGFCI